MAIRVKTVLIGLLGLAVVGVAGMITAIGWQVVLGPDARPVTDRRFESSEARLERGRYLVEGPGHCLHCHTDHDFSLPTAPIIQARRGAGFEMPIPELNNINARNITSDRETGIGAWTDDEIARAIREGIRRDGTALFPIMPYPSYRDIDDEDIASIVVYLRTLPPVRNVVAPRALPFPLEYIVKTIPEPLTEPRLSHPSSTAVERGAYLVKVAECAECHTTRIEPDGPVPGMGYAGGNAFSLPGTATVVSANITPDASGIAHYDEALFAQTLRTGLMGGRPLSPVMPVAFYRNMTDGDLADLFAYLRAQPPVKHRVNNTDPPTPCPLCAKSHGLGNLNAAPGK